MATDYERVYRDSKHALGEPTREFVDFFGSLEASNLRVLDVGCGQGRDALFIARLGHRVVGVDLSPTGIRDLLADAATGNLNIEGHVADLRDDVPRGEFDVLLIDRTLHMLDSSKRIEVLSRLLRAVGPAGVVLIADQQSNIPAFESVLADDARHWRVLKKRRGYLFVQRERDSAA